MIPEKIGDKRGYKWWFTPEYLAAIKRERGLTVIIPLSRKVEAFVADNRDRFSTIPLDEIYDEIFRQFPGALLPDLKFLVGILKNL